MTPLRDAPSIHRWYCTKAPKLPRLVPDLSIKRHSERLQQQPRLPIRSRRRLDEHPAARHHLGRIELCSGTESVHIPVKADPNQFVTYPVIDFRLGEQRHLVGSKTPREVPRAVTRCRCNRPDWSARDKPNQPLLFMGHPRLDSPRIPCQSLMRGNTKCTHRSKNS